MPYTLVHNGTLIDGSGRAPVPDAALLLDGKVIKDVGRLADLRQPEGEITTLDAQGGWILPGFIDAHVHIMFEGHDMVQAVSRPFALKYYLAIDHMRRTIEAGVTSVRDAGGAELGVKQAVEQGLILGPRLQISVNALSITGGHGDDWLPGGGSHFTPEGPGVPDGICDGVPGALKKVREVLRAGADIVKIHATGGVLSPTDRPDFVQFSPEELNAIVQEADRRGGVKVMAHAQAAGGIKNAVLAGIYSIEHGIFIDEECMELMLARGTWLVPTLIAPVAVVEAANTQNVPEWGLRKAREVIDIHRENIAKAYRAGVKIALGTDSAVGPHGSNLRELGLLCNIGMSPMEAIVAGTRRAAECLGWQDRLGTLEPGKLADVVISRCDPLADIGALADVDNIVTVFKDGRIVKDRRAG